MSKRTFAKYEGAGNDFILIDDRVESFPLHDTKYIQKLCHRKFGIGADGLILLQLDLDADFRMRIFNCDGSEAESCGNGLRCLVQFLSDLGHPRTPFRIRTDKRIVQAAWRNEKIAIHMGYPHSLQLNLSFGEFLVHAVDTGVPHAVLFVPDVQSFDLVKMAPFFRHHPHFQPRGTNVNVASFNGDGTLSVRTFEKGVEGEVLACGTGAAAVAFIASRLYSLPSLIPLFFSGGKIEIEVQESGVTLVGGSSKVFEGILY